MICLSFELIAQDINSNLKKYWYMRDRLRKDFIVVSPDNTHGTNIPFSRRNTTNFDNPPIGRAILSSGDGNDDLQYYIAMLATEYRLLKDYGQDYDTTFYELTYALHAFERLDKYGETFHEGQPNLNGYFVRYDIHDMNIYENYPDHSYLHDAVIHSGWQAHDNPYDKNEMSQDNAWHYLMALALVEKLVDDKRTVIDAAGSVVTVKEWVRKISYRVLNYMRQGGCLINVNLSFIADWIRSILPDFAENWNVFQNLISFYENYNKCIMLAPIFRNLEITTDENTIGPYMYNYLKTNNLNCDKKEVKLTTLLSTHGKFMPFSSYYLWFLIDNFGLVIDDMDYFISFDKHDKFSNFVTTFMQDRIKNGIIGKNKGIDMLRKIALNGSYGYDIMNTENFTNIQLKDKKDTFTAHLSPNFMSERKINDDLYQINTRKKSFNCNTPIQEGFFTLDNAKFWYLNFLYNFIFKCIDMDKFHLIEGDTDSIYFACSGDVNQGPEQKFNAIIKDKEFYDKYAKYYLPTVTDKNNNNDGKIYVYDEKKPLGCTVEKYGYSMYALAPKCYTIIREKDGSNSSCKIKGVSLRQNNHISGENYENILKGGEVLQGENRLLTLKNGVMSKIAMTKNALSAAMTKMIVNENGACYPFIHKF